MAENTTVSKITISKDNATKLVTSVKDGLALVNKGYLSITPDVARLYDTKAYEVLGYKNFDELCVNEFGMSHGTTVGIRKVFALYGTKSSKDGSYTIPEKYTEFGYTKLLLFATDAKKFEQAGINPIEEFNPKMTIGEMKEALKFKLEDKAKEQDASAIDTTATEVAEDTTATEVAEDTTATEAAEDTTATEVAEYNAIENIDYMLELAKKVREQLTEKKVKPEKMALLDAIEANLKDLKKVAK